MEKLKTPTKPSTKTKQKAKPAQAQGNPLATGLGLLLGLGTLATLLSETSEPVKEADTDFYKWLTAGDVHYFYSKDTDGNEVGYVFFKTLFQEEVYGTKYDKWQLLQWTPKTRETCSPAISTFILTRHGGTTFRFADKDGQCHEGVSGFHNLQNERGWPWGRVTLVKDFVQKTFLRIHEVPEEHRSYIADIIIDAMIKAYPDAGA